MNILYVSNVPVQSWRKAVRRLIPEANLYVWGEDAIDPDAVDYIMVWNPPKGVLAQFTKAKAIFNLGAGVDGLMDDLSLPHNIPIVRLVDPRLSSGMTEFIVYWVLHFHRSLHSYNQQQRAHHWGQHTPFDTKKRAVGILGLGELGTDAAHALLMMGFENIAGWSRSPKELPGLKSFAGPNELETFLARTEILVCMLPNTPQTQGLLNAKTLRQLPKGAFVINVGRGGLIVEQDLIQALTSGHIQAAALDVFNVEPLSSSHPFWTMDNVYVTPHIASVTSPTSATQIIADGIKAITDGYLPNNVVDFDQGY